MRSSRERYCQDIVDSAAISASTRTFGNMPNYCYNFGVAYAQFQRRDLDLRKLSALCLEAGLTSSHGSNGERDALIGAFDEYKRLMNIELDRPPLDKER